MRSRRRSAGRAPKCRGGGIYRVGIGRSDLSVTLDGVQIKPPLALGSYLAFQKMGNEAMVMGDLVLLQEEVNPVMKKLIEQGIQVTAIHNHLLRATPMVMSPEFSKLPIALSRASAPPWAICAKADLLTSALLPPVSDNVPISNIVMPPRLLIVPPLAWAPCAKAKPPWPICAASPL